MPVSYHHDVAKIFAYHCTGCRGEAGGLNLRTYRAVMEGGNKGKVLIAGDPENSLIIQFIEGRRGAAHRMPAGGAPLSAQQTATLRQWIAEGAKEDAEPAPHVRQFDNVKLPGRITCTVPVQAYLTITAANPASGQILWSDTASIKTPKEQNDAGQPGQPIHWDLRQAPGWPPSVTIRLTLQHTTDPRLTPVLNWVAVGTGLTTRPPHRSVRAALPHTAPTANK